MKQLGLVTAGILFSFAQTGEVNAADVCGDDLPSVTRSGPDTISVLFSSIVATSSSSARCVVPPIATERMDAPGTFLVYSADYRGFVNPGDTARLTIDQRAMSETATIAGSDADFFLRSYTGSNGTDTLNSTVQLQLTEAEFPSNEATLDSVEYVLAATTTRGELEASLDDVGTQRTATLVQLQTVAGLLTGIDRPLDRPDEFRLLGTGGTYLAGAAGRWSLSDTLTLDAGAAAFGLSEDETDARGGMAAATLHYLAPAEADWRPFTEAGIDLAPLKQRFARDYDDGTDDGADGSASTHGFAGGLHAGAGVLVQPDDANRIALFATAAQDWFATGGYSEDFGEDNLFAAAFGSETTSLTTLKLGAAWTATVTPGLDVTLNAAAGHAFAAGTLHADVSFAGDIEGSVRDDTFLQYGARLGFKPAPSFSADLFAQGISARASGTHVFWGGSLGRSF